MVTPLSSIFHAQMLFQERNHLRIAVQLILALGESVSLVLIAQITHFDAAGFDIFNDHIRFRHRNTRIVRAMDDHQRRLDIAHFGNRRNVVERFAVMRQRAVFALAVRAAIFARIFEEGHQVGHADHVHARCPKLRIARPRRRGS